MPLLNEIDRYIENNSEEYRLNRETLDEYAKMKKRYLKRLSQDENLRETVNDHVATLNEKCIFLENRNKFLGFSKIYVLCLGKIVIKRKISDCVRDAIVPYIHDEPKHDIIPKITTLLRINNLHDDVIIHAINAFKMIYPAEQDYIIDYLRKNVTNAEECLEVISRISKCEQHLTKAARP